MTNKITKRTFTKPLPNQSPSTTMSAGPIQIALCNVNGILKILEPPNNAKTKSWLTPVIDALIQAIGGPSKIPDIFCIQETHLQENPLQPHTPPPPNKCLLLLLLLLCVWGFLSLFCIRKENFY